MNTLSLFNDWLNGDGFYGMNRAFSPDVDVTETKTAYTVEMDIPGRTENDVSIELNDKVLTIASVDEKTAQTSEEENEEEKPQYLLRERRFAQFRRSFTLPKDIDTENVRAEFKNGVLSIVIPRKAEAQPNRIAISVA